MDWLPYLCNYQQYMGIKIKVQYMYMNGSVFSNARYMNGVVFQILAHTPVPQLPPSYPSPPSPHPQARFVLWACQNKVNLHILCMLEGTVRLTWPTCALCSVKRDSLERNNTSKKLKQQILVQCITKTCLYNIDPLKPHFYIVKLGFTGVYIIFLISAQKHRLWVLVRTASLRRF